jgi:RNA polymerase sigma factor (sigma-70 family)
MTADAIADDATLARGVASGDASRAGACLAAIYDRYGGPLLGFCQNMLRRSADAEDCLQDVFVIAATRLGDLREPDRLRSWLYSVARHECLARLDKRNREQLMDDVPDRASAEYDQPASVAIDHELANLLSDMTAGLSDRDRLLLELADRQQLTGDELADALGVPRATAYTLVGRARLTARTSLGALLVARTGRDRCAELDHLLTGWDGRLTTLRRKQIARHIDGCDICRDQRDRVATPIALLGEGKAFAADLVALRMRILAAASGALLAPPSAADAGWSNGWPPVDPEFGRRRPRWWLALPILLVVLLIGGGAVIAVVHDSGSTAAPTITSAAAGSASASATQSISSSAAPTPSVPLPAEPAAPAGPASHSAASTSAPSSTSAAPSSSASSKPTGPWTVTLRTAKGGAATVMINGGTAQTCGAGLTCEYLVADQASVRINRRGGVFTAPPSCAVGNPTSCTIVVTANTAVTLVTPGTAVN